MLQLAVGVALGIVAVEWLPMPVAPALALGLLSVVLGVSVPAWAWLALGVALGAARYELWRATPPAEPPPARALLRAVGTLEPVRNGYRLLCAFEQPPRPDFVLVYFRPQVSRPPDYGDVFQIETTWRRPPRFKRFDWAKYLERRRVHYIGTVFSERQFAVVQSGRDRWQRQFTQARQSLRHVLRKHLAPESAALLEGMLVGATGDFPPELREAFHRAGTGHLLATSGLHVAIGLHAVYWALRWTPVPFAGRMGLVVAFAWLYALLAGLRPSIVRAATMATCLLSAGIVGREADSLNALGLAGALWLLIAPHALFEVGFQYSFCAVLFILLFYSRLERGLSALAQKLHVPTPLRRVVHQGIPSLLSVTLCAQAGISLVQLYHFGHMSLLSPIANLLAVPLAYPTLLMGFWLWLSQGVGAGVAEWLCTWQISVAYLFGAAWVPSIRLEGLPAPLVVAFYAAVLLCAPEPPLAEPEEQV